MMSKEKKTSALYTSILYLCGLILFLEWLYPLEHMAEVSNFRVFIIFTIYCFLLSLLQLRWWAAVPLKLAGMIFIVHLLYLHAPFMSKLWFELLYVELTYNFQEILSQNWYSLTSVFRSILFLLIIWIMSYLIHYWFYVMKRFFLFILLTFIYITIIDTFTLYDAQMSVIRIFIVSFIALGIANFVKEVNNQSINFAWIKRTPIWVIPIISSVLIASVIGYAAPKYNPQWPDPVPFFKGVVDGSKSWKTDDETIKKVGYGEDDSTLGGSFIQDYSVVFEAIAMKDHYWRIETKDLYTGKGWEQSRITNKIEQNSRNIPNFSFTDEVASERLEAAVNFQRKEAIDRLVYPYTPIEVHELGAVELLIDTSTEAIHTQLEGEKVKLSGYKLTYESPLFDLDALKSIKTDEISMKGYLQLPESLPERVHDLAEDITAPYSNMYDQAMAIERYFQQNGFVYQIDDIPVPQTDEDYVDQFLFDTKAGYCDNYSTSMVVLLRSAGIPARWAKGFTSGTNTGESVVVNGEDFNSYEVTNANAHSWVEVFFEGIGWVPFEPTKGFTNQLEYTESETDDSNDSNDLNLEENDAAGEIENSETNDPEIPQPKEDLTTPETNQAEKSITWFKTNYMIIGSILLLIIIGAIIYKTRYRWRTRMISRKLNKKENIESFDEAYHYLLGVLARQGIKKQPDQTLREYAKHIDQRFMTTEMQILTNHYENFLYNNEREIKVEHELLDIWNSLMKRVIT